ncbi:putative reverse transcriptase zinc-binding domain-containing protein [Helianthus anomalus]
MAFFRFYFQLEKDRWCTVAEKTTIGANGPTWVWDWRRQLNSTEELLGCTPLHDLLQGCPVTSGPDKWFWNLDQTGQFNVGNIKRPITEHNWVRPEYVVKWNNWIPKKVGLVTWRAYKERLPTRVALSRRGVSVQSVECVMCGEYNKTSDHLLVSCGFSQIVWHIVY